jgi:hypothetical protein
VQVRLAGAVRRNPLAGIEVLWIHAAGRERRRNERRNPLAGIEVLWIDPERFERGAENIKS